jgi:hypothetical protein
MMMVISTLGSHLPGVHVFQVFGEAFFPPCRYLGGLSFTQKETWGPRKWTGVRPLGKTGQEDGIPQNTNTYDEAELRCTQKAGHLRFK